MQKEALQIQHDASLQSDGNKEKLGEEMWKAIRELQEKQSPATMTAAETTFDPDVTPNRISKVSKDKTMPYSLMARKREETQLTGEVKVKPDVLLYSPNTSADADSTLEDGAVSDTTRLRERIRKLEETSTTTSSKSHGTSGKYSMPYKFEGKEGDVITLWLKLFEDWCRSARIDFQSTEMIGAMLRFVGTNVMTAYQAMNSDEQTSWTAVRKKLLDNWSPVRAKDYARKSFTKREQGPNESYRQYMDCLAELGNKGWGKDCTDEKVNLQFFNGVKDRRVKKQMNNAFQFDPLDTLDRPTMVYVAEAAQKVVLEKVAIDADAGKESNKDTPRKVISAGQNNSLPAAIATRNREEQQRATRGRYPDKSDWKDKVLCYGCGQTGHIIRECPNAFLTKSPHHVNVMCELVGSEKFERFCDEAGITVENTDENMTLRVINQMMNVECFTCGQRGHFSTQCRAENADPREGQRARESVARRREKEMRMDPRKNPPLVEEGKVTQLQNQLEAQAKMMGQMSAQMQVLQNVGVGGRQQDQPWQQQQQYHALPNRAPMQAIEGAPGPSNAVVRVTTQRTPAPPHEVFVQKSHQMRGAGQAVPPVQLLKVIKQQDMLIGPEGEITTDQFNQLTQQEQAECSMPLTNYRQDQGN